jgi:fructosamine-3-kinase
LHRQSAQLFGCSGDNDCGATPQANMPDSDGYQFFAQKLSQSLS